MDTKNVIHYLANTSGQISNTALQLVEQQIFEMNKISKKNLRREQWNILRMWSYIWSKCLINLTVQEMWILLACS